MRAGYASVFLSSLSTRQQTDLIRRILYFTLSFSDR